MWYITTTFRKLVVHFFLLAFVIFSQYEKMEVFFTVKIKTTYTLLFIDWQLFVFTILWFLYYRTCLPFVQLFVLLLLFYQVYFHITGWQRYDHFAVLCELLPAGLPSLALDLIAVSSGQQILNPFNIAICKNKMTNPPRFEPRRPHPRQ